jgi:hypothetical protein
VLESGYGAGIQWQMPRILNRASKVFAVTKKEEGKREK